MKDKQTRRKNRRPVKHDRSKFFSRLPELLLCAVITALIVEGFNQGSPARMLDYLANRTLYFGINCMLILATLSL